MIALFANIFASRAPTLSPALRVTSVVRGDVRLPADDAPGDCFPADLIHCKPPFTLSGISATPGAWSPRNRNEFAGSAS